MAMKCIFESSKSIYKCRIENVVCKSDNLDLDCTNHAYKKTNNDVKCLIIESSIIPKIPKGIESYFENLEELKIMSSHVKILENDDIKFLKKLKSVSLDFNEIEYIPGEFFKGLTNLERISIKNNKIKYIAPNSFDELKLKSINLLGNVNINENADTILKVQELVEKIAKDCKPDIFCQLKYNMKNEEQLMDFTIKIDDKEFRAHKLLLAARSPILAEQLKIITNKPELRLIGIPSEIFLDVLAFIHYDTLPPPKSDFLLIYDAAGVLKIDELKKFAADQLLGKITFKNVFKILELSNKYDNPLLRFSAFTVIKEMFPFRDFDKNLLKEPEKLKKLCALKRKLDEELDEFLV